MKKEHLISILVPFFSVLIIAGAYFFIQPSTTGLVIYEPNDTLSLVNADVSLELRDGEVIPPDANIEVWLDKNMARMSISDFIKKSGQKYEIKKGELLDFGFLGQGFTGNYKYNLTLADFNLNRNIGKGEHIFITRIVYRNYILYEKENKIMIS